VDEKCYENGESVELNYKKAMGWYIKSKGLGEISVFDNIIVFTIID
jgi:hypothetical protein